jgi:Uma2 family endonuclease
MASGAVKTHTTPREYLAFERQSPLRHEYYEGSIYAMSGASREHNLIAGNLHGEIRAQLRDRPREVVSRRVSPCGAATPRPRPRPGRATTS